MKICSNLFIVSIINFLCKTYFLNYWRIFILVVGPKQSLVAVPTKTFRLLFILHLHISLCSSLAYFFSLPVLYLESPCPTIAMEDPQQTSHCKFEYFSFIQSFLLGVLCVSFSDFSFFSLSWQQQQQWILANPFTWKELVITLIWSTSYLLVLSLHPL